MHWQQSVQYDFLIALHYAHILCYSGAAELKKCLILGVTPQAGGTASVIYQIVPKNLYYLEMITIIGAFWCENGDNGYHSNE